MFSGERILLRWNHVREVTVFNDSSSVLNVWLIVSYAWSYFRTNLHTIVRTWYGNSPYLASSPSMILPPCSFVGTPEKLHYFRSKSAMESSRWQTFWIGHSWWVFRFRISWHFSKKCIFLYFFSPWQSATRTKRPRTDCIVATVWRSVLLVWRILKSFILKIEHSMHKSSLARWPENREIRLINGFARFLTYFCVRWAITWSFTHREILKANHV